MIYLLFLLCISSALTKSIHPPQLGHDPRIISGVDAKPGQFPWQVLMNGVASDTEISTCSGVIISENWILTTASCIQRALFIIIEMGSVEHMDANSNDTVLLISLDKEVHEEYNLETLENDIGLVYLFHPLTFDETIKPIQLSDEELEGGVVATISGWGTTTPDDHYAGTSILQYANVTVLANDECEERFNGFPFGPGRVCTIGDSGETPCFGDAGGPLVLNFDSDAVLVALFSFLGGENCGDYPAGYTRTGYYRDWIREKTGV